MIYAVIIAGGSGKRLWPASRKNYPKFLLKLDGKYSLLNQAVSRARKFISKDNLLILANKAHKRVILGDIKGISGKNILAEPASRNTAPCVSLAALLINKINPNAVMYVLPADQFMKDSSVVKEAFSLSGLVAGMRKVIVTIGIRPSFAATGYGYIKKGAVYKTLKAGAAYRCYKAERFTEKPSLKKAKDFIRSKKYLWNSGIFIAKAATFIAEFKKCAPGIYRNALRAEKSLEKYYKKFPDISIDYALMEKTKAAYVVEADMKWQDAGSWKNMQDILGRDKKGNTIRGKSVLVNTKNSVISTDKKHLVAAIGLNNMVVVHTKDATLVCPKNKAEEVKKLIEKIEKKKDFKRFV